MGQLRARLAGLPVQPPEMSLGDAIIVETGFAGEPHELSDTFVVREVQVGESPQNLDAYLSKMVDLLQHVEERLLRRGGRDDGGDGDPFMPIDVTVDAGEIDQDGRQAEDEEHDNEAERQEKLFPDRQMAKPTGGNAAHGVPYHRRPEGLQCRPDDPKR